MQFLTLSVVSSRHGLDSLTYFYRAPDAPVGELSFRVTAAWHVAVALRSLRQMSEHLVLLIRPRPLSPSPPRKSGNQVKADASGRCVAQNKARFSDSQIIRSGSSVLSVATSGEDTKGKSGNVRGISSVWTFWSRRLLSF